MLSARAAMVNDATVTATVPASKITFGSKPQTSAGPSIVLEAARADYDATFESYAKAITYRAAYRFYSSSTVQLAEMVDTMKGAILLHTDEELVFRIEEEGLTVDPDGDGVAFIVVTIQDLGGQVNNLVQGTDKTLKELVQFYNENK